MSMIRGAMRELGFGNPKHLDIECGPVINSAAQIKLQQYIDKARQNVPEGLSKNIKFEVKSISESLGECGRSSCNLILLNEVVFYYPEWRTDFKVIVDSLDTGGFVFISFRSQYFNALHAVKNNKWENI